jgi:hypothetical protein
MAKIKQEELEKVTSIKKELDALVSEIGVVETQEACSITQSSRSK